jgi:hypothetical protein
MSIGLDLARSSPRGSPSGTAQPTVREVCLLGRRSGGARERAWATGRRVRWLGRGYQVVATSVIPPGRSAGRSVLAATHRYIHLAPSEE